MSAVAVAPEPTAHEARMAALEIAYAVRQQRTAERGRVAALPREKGRTEVTALLRDPPPWLMSARVADVLRWPHRQGKLYARRVMEIAQVPERRRVRGLSDDERRRLVWLNAQGHPYSGPWTRETAVAALQRAARKAGRTPTLRMVEADRGLPTYRAIMSLFGGLKGYARAAGLEPSADGPLSKAGDEGVPTALLREAFAASGLTGSELARRIGWVEGKGKRAGRPNSSRVMRTLGLRTDGEGRMREHVREETAVALLRAMNLDPVDVGL